MNMIIIQKIVVINENQIMKNYLINFVVLIKSIQIIISHLL